MTPECQYPICRSSVPPALDQEGLCTLHFIRKIDARCREFRREALCGPLTVHRRAEINQYLYSQAVILAQIATSGTRLPDDTRPCLLSVFLTLINVCERVARASGDEQEEADMATIPSLTTAWHAAAAK